MQDGPFSSSWDREEQEPVLGTEQTQATERSVWHWELCLNMPAVPCTREGFNCSPRKRDGRSQKYYTPDRRKLRVKYLESIIAARSHRILKQGNHQFLHKLQRPQKTDLGLQMPCLPYNNEKATFNDIGYFHRKKCFRK